MKLDKSESVRKEFDGIMQNGFKTIARKRFIFDCCADIYLYKYRLRLLLEIDYLHFAQSFHTKSFPAKMYFTIIPLPIYIKMNADKKSCVSLMQCSNLFLTLLPMFQKLKCYCMIGAKYH